MARKKQHTPGAVSMRLRQVPCIQCGKKFKGRPSTQRCPACRKQHRQSAGFMRPLEWGRGPW